MERIRQVIYYKKYFLDFFDQQTTRVKEKIDHVLFVVTVAERIPRKFFNIWKEQTDYMKYELSFRETFTEYSAALTKDK
ncbi:MAG: hypothetical protein ABI378_10420 [Chitinophagaceae bacterium]